MYARTKLKFLKRRTKLKNQREPSFGYPRTTRHLQHLRTEMKNGDRKKFASRVACNWLVLDFASDEQRYGKCQHPIPYKITNRRAWENSAGTHKLSLVPCIKTFPVTSFPNNKLWLQEKNNDMNLRQTNELPPFLATGWSWILFSLSCHKHARTLFSATPPRWKFRRTLPGLRSEDLMIRLKISMADSKFEGAATTIS